MQLYSGCRKIVSMYTHKEKNVNMTVDRGSALLTHSDEIIVCVSLHTDKICFTFLCTYTAGECLKHTSI